MPRETRPFLTDRLFAQKSDIERELGEPLEWERLDDSRASRVAVYRDGHIERTAERLPEIRTWAIDHLLRLKAVFGPRLQQGVNDASAQDGA